MNQSLAPQALGSTLVSGPPSSEQQGMVQKGAHGQAGPMKLVSGTGLQSLKTEKEELFLPGLLSWWAVRRGLGSGVREGGSWGIKCGVVSLAEP